MKYSFLILMMFFASFGVYATSPNVGVSVDLSNCDFVTTTASVYGVGSAVSNGAMASGASGSGLVTVVPVTSGVTAKVSGDTNVYNNGRADNVSTGNGSGRAEVYGKSGSDIGATVTARVPGVGVVTQTGNIAADAVSGVTASPNTSGVATSATAEKFDGNTSLVRTGDRISGVLADTKSGQSIVNATGNAGLQSVTSGAVAVSGNVVGRYGATIPVVNCFTSHDVSGTPSTSCH